MSLTGRMTTSSVQSTANPFVSETSRISRRGHYRVTPTKPGACEGGGVRDAGKPLVEGDGTNGGRALPKTGCVDNGVLTRNVNTTPLAGDKLLIISVSSRDSPTVEPT